MIDVPLCDAIRTVLASRSSIELGIVFGSVARGTERPDSDVDVAVQMPRPMTPEEKMSLIGDLAAATGRAIDLVDLRTAGEPLLGEILKQGQRLLGGDEAHGDLIYRHLVDSADFLPLVERMLAERRQAWIG